MPIKPENKARYPKNWKQIRISILERCHNRYDAEHRKETRLSNKSNSKIKNS